MQRCFCGKRFDCSIIRLKTPNISAFIAVFLQKTKISDRRLGAIQGNTLA
jgi:hypothetical protein